MTRVKIWSSWQRNRISEPSLIFWRLESSISVALPGCLVVHVRRARRVDTVPRLVLINGAPGSGKSTLARRYAQDHPLTLALDIDRVRGMLGRWLDTPTQWAQHG